MNPAQNTSDFQKCVGNHVPLLGPLRWTATGVCPSEFPDELFGDRDYCAFLRSADDMPFPWLAPEILPERKFILIHSKSSLEDCAVNDFRGFELNIKRNSNNEPSPHVRFANKFGFHARHIVPFIGSAAALGGIPVLSPTPHSTASWFGTRSTKVLSSCCTGWQHKPHICKKSRNINYPQT